jgi:hypothetical protein
MVAGFAFAIATRSLAELTPSSGRTTSVVVTLTTWEIGAKSRTGS